MKKVFKIALISVVVMFLIWIIVLNLKGEKMNYTQREENNVTIYSIEDHEYAVSEEETDLVLLDVKNVGIMVAELYPSIAPITVNNFKNLVKSNFYSNFIFHRIIANFMIQTGDPTGTGFGGSENAIKGEFAINNIKNDLSHTRGVLSMARSGSTPETDASKNSATSQFFIVQKDSTYLDGSYAAFGKLIHGYDVLDKVATVRTDENDKPVEDVVLKSVIFVKEYKG